MANHNYNQFGNVDFPHNFNFAPSRSFNGLTAPTWGAQASGVSGVSSRSSYTHRAFPHPGVRKIIGLPRVKSPGFDFISPSSSGASVNSSNIDHSGFHNLYPETRPSAIPFQERPAPAQSSNHRINNFLNDSSSPWVPLNPHSVPLTRKSSSLSHQSAPQFDTHTYRSNPQSEVESVINPCPSDSGYHSRTVATRSVRSGEFDLRADLPDEIITQVGTYNPFAMSGSSPDSDANKPDIRKSASPSRSRGGKRTCERCNAVLKCPSDYKKHMLKHEKPHRCDYPNCQRTEGFITVNDLQRHKKSVHKIGVVDSMTKSYKCASPNCKSPAKLWPRLDNFKQHLIRMHKEEDVAELITRSEVKGTVDTDDTGNPSMERDLAGVDGVSNSAAQITVDPDELQVNSSLESYQSAAKLRNMRSRPLNEQPAFTSVLVSYQRSSATQKAEELPAFQCCWASQLRCQGTVQISGAACVNCQVQGLNNQYVDRRTGSSSNRVQEPNAQSLTTLADAALASPPNSVLLSGHTKSSGLSSNFVASPDRFSTSEIRTPQDDNDLAKSLTRNLSELATARDDVRDQIIRALDSSSDVYRSLELIVDSKRRKRKGSHGSPTDSSSQKSRLSPGVQCERCKKVVPRKCDLKKHMKRHTKPYACCWGPDCDKISGSKSDWKRHEQSHQQWPAWVCHHPDPKVPLGKCMAWYEHESKFLQHLSKEHDVTSYHKDYKTIVTQSSIGVNNQPRFWCGFCKSTVEQLSPQNFKKWSQDNRFDHIHQHFENSEHRDESWVYYQTGMTRDERQCKLKMGEDHLKLNFPTPLDAISRAHSHRAGIPDVIITSSDERGPRQPKKRKSADVQQTEDMWQCCQCSYGPQPSNLHTSCGAFDSDCIHVRCSNCVSLPCSKKQKLSSKGSPSSMEHSISAR